MAVVERAVRWAWRVGVLGGFWVEEGGLRRVWRVVEVEGGVLDGRFWCWWREDILGGCGFGRLDLVGGRRRRCRGVGDVVGSGFFEGEDKGVC